MASSGPPAASVRGLRHFYPARRGETSRPALDGIDLEIAPGELFGLLGPNGGGKTTLTRVLTTALSPSEGSASVFGSDVVLEPRAARRSIGVVFQHESLDRKLTVEENLRCQGRLYGLSGAELGARVAELLGRFGLSGRAREAVERLSGGLRRRAELAKSLLHRPRLLILDEPTTGLDPAARLEFWGLVGELRAGGETTLLVATHLMEEAERCGRLAVLDRGRVVAQGTPEGLKDEIGGDVLVVRTQDPAALLEQARARFGVQAFVADGAVHIERPEGHAFIPALVEAFPGRVLSVTLSKPSLEEVFIRRTRHGFWERA